MPVVYTTPKLNENVSWRRDPYGPSRMNAFNATRLRGSRSCGDETIKDDSEDRLSDQHEAHSSTEERFRPFCIHNRE